MAIQVDYTEWDFSGDCILAREKTLILPNARTLQSLLSALETEQLLLNPDNLPTDGEVLL